MYDVRSALEYPTLDKSILKPTGVTIPKKEQPDVGLVEKVCLTPNEIFGSPIAQGFGFIAEALISYKLTAYYAENKIAPVDIYNDNSFAGSRDKGYVGFLRQKNPNLSNEAINEISNSYLKRPDLLIDSGAVRAFYEIKPESVPGIDNGEKKLAAIESYFGTYKLSYKRGGELKLKEIELGQLSLLVEDHKVPVKVYFRLRHNAGLITYKLCIETAWRFLIERSMTELLVQSLYNYFVEIIKGIKDLRDRLTEQMEEFPLYELSAVALVLVASILAGIYLSAASVALATAITVSAVSFELAGKSQLGIQNPGNTKDSRLAL